MSTVNKRHGMEVEGEYLNFFFFYVRHHKAYHAHEINSKKILIFMLTVTMMLPALEKKSYQIFNL